MLNRRNKKKIIIILLCVLCFIMTIGYSVFKDLLVINGVSKINGDFNVVFADVTEDWMRDSETVNIDGIGTDNLNIKMNFQKPGSSADYIVTLENRGTYDAYIEFINLEPSIPEDFHFWVGDEEYYDFSHYGPHYIKKGETLKLTLSFSWSYSATTIPKDDIQFKIQIKATQQPNYEGFSFNLLSDAVNKQLEMNDTYNYMNGTYLKGDRMYGNYVWFDGFLWRIMGKNADGSIRMITEEDVSIIPWNEFAEKDVYEERNYEESYVNDWLNNYFYTKLKDKDMIVNSNWCSEITEDAYSRRTTCDKNLFTTQVPVGTLSLDEYMLSGNPNEDNYAWWSGASTWLTNRQVFYTLTPQSNNSLWYIGGNGNSYKTTSIGTSRSNEFGIGMRPIINIKADSIIDSGVGSINDPYVIQTEKSLSNFIKDKGLIGEYVVFAGKNYRIMDTNENGTKLILDGYYDPNNNGEIEDEEKFIYFTFDEYEYHRIPYTETKLFSEINSDEVINWISNNNEAEKNKIVTNTWYQGEEWGYNSEYSHNYYDSIFTTKNPYIGKVGLVRVGEILAAQSETILSQNHTIQNDWNKAESYWTSNVAGIPKGFINAGYEFFSIGTDGFYYEGTTWSEYALRPVILIDPNVQITSGDGTFNNPYRI